MKSNYKTRKNLYRGAEDCKWLRDVHLVHSLEIAPYFRSFVLSGNEDYPDAIELYESDDPTIDETPVLSLILDADDRWYRRA